MAGVAFLYPNSERRLYASVERLTAHGAGRENGSLPYRMDAKQRREAVRLIRAHCSFYDNGNCLYLDDGEEVVCPQITSFSVICSFFRQVVLKDEAARGWRRSCFRVETAKTLPCAAGPFLRLPTMRNTAPTAGRRCSEGRRLPMPGGGGQT